MSPTTLELLRFGLDVTLKVTFLLLAGQLALIALRRAPASLRHAVATFALMGTLALPVLALLVPRWQFPIVPSLLPDKVETVSRAARTPRWEPAAVSSSIERAKISGESERPERPLSAARPRDTDTAALSPSSPATIFSAAPARISPAAAARRRGAWMPWALLIWALGAAVSLVRLISGSARVRSISRHAVTIWDLDWILAKEEICARLGIDRPVALLASDRVPIAMTWGARRPVLLLAGNARRWPAERQRVVLLHELAHVQRRDWIALWIAEIVRALYWFHPLAWTVVEQARRDCEKACDDVVLGSGTKASVYAAHLLGIVRSLQAARQRLLPAVPMARPSQFEGRMRSILDAGRNRRRISTFEKGLAVAGVFGIVLAVAAMEPWAKCPQQRTAFFDRIETAPISAFLGLVPVAADGSRHAAQPGAASPKKPCPFKPAIAPAVYPGAPLRKDPAVAPLRAKAPCKGDRGGVDGGIDEAVPAAVLARVATNVEERVAEGIEKGIARGADEGVDGASRTAAPKLAGFQMASHRDGWSGGDWYSQGMRLHNKGRYEEAIEAFQKSIDLGHREDAASYNIACGYARLGKSAEAMEWLRRAVDEGFELEKYINRDDDLDSLRKLPEFRDLSHSFNRGKAAAAERRLASLSERSSAKGEAFYRLGKELLSDESFDASAQAFQKSADLGYRVGASLYNEACARARADQGQEALNSLEKALLAGFDDAGLVRKDDDLDNIRGQERYKELQRLAEDLSLSLPSGDWNVLGFGKHQWRKAIAHYREIAHAHPQIGRAWFNLGYAAIRSSEFEEATQALERALALGYRRPTTMYNMACSYALRGERDKAFDWLFQSLDAGFDGSNIDDDHDLDALHGDSRFRKALDKAEKIKVAEKD